MCVSNITSDIQEVCLFFTVYLLNPEMLVLSKNAPHWQKSENHINKKTANEAKGFNQGDMTSGATT